jgi:hypothetical protein
MSPRGGTDSAVSAPTIYLGRFGGGGTGFTCTGLIGTNFGAGR